MSQDTDKLNRAIDNHLRQEGILKEEIEVYDVWAKKEGADRFLFRAPLTTISLILRLHKDAVARIQRETAEGRACFLSGKFAALDRWDNDPPLIVTCPGENIVRSREAL